MTHKERMFKYTHSEKGKQTARKRLFTKNGLISRIYTNQTTNSKRRGHGKQEYSVQELRQWLVGQEIFHVLFEQWEESSFNINKRPSVDRINNAIGYSLSNIQLTTWEDNRNKNLVELAIKKSIEVLQIDASGNVVASFCSAKEANRETGANYAHINEVCNGKRKTANGYIWKFKDVA